MPVQPKLVIRFNYLPQAAANVPRAGMTIRERMINDFIPIARQHARVDTGRMRDSIRRTEHGESRSVVTAGGGDVVYAGFNEFGTIKMSAQPFMRPAAEIVASRCSGGAYSGDLEGLLIGGGG